MSILRTSQQVLSTAYGSAVIVTDGAQEITVTTDDAAIGFVVRIAGVNEEQVPAGSSWKLSPPQPGIGDDLSLEIKSDSGTPTASIVWFR
jgi:hypothetical protein